MPEEVYIVIGCLIGLYLLSVIIIGCVVRSLLKDIKRKEKALQISMAQKYDLIISLGDLMTINKIRLPNYVKSAISYKKRDGLKDYITSERLSIKTLLTKTVDTLFYIAEDNGLLENEKYQTLKKFIVDIDIRNRKDIASYNSQIIAYNYWIRTWLFKPISKLFRLKKKEIMY